MIEEPWSLEALPPDQWVAEVQGEKCYFGMWLRKSPDGESTSVYWLKFNLYDLPNPLVGIDDLKRLGIDLIHLRAATKIKERTSFRF